MVEKLPSYICYWLTEARHDCFFIVGHESRRIERIGALKVFLMGHSEPFRAMLQDSELAEKGDIRITDVEPETFWNLLKCVYGASDVIIPKFTFEECAKLVYVAEKYLLMDIKGKVSKRLQSLFSLSFDNIFIALSHPIFHQEELLKNRILDILKNNYEQIITNEKFLDLSCVAVEWVITREHFQVREIEIWNAVLRWAKHKTKSTDGEVLRSYIFDFLKFFCFVEMDCKEFCTKVVESNILHDHEVFEICKSFSSGATESIKRLFDNKNKQYIPKTVSEKIVSSFVGNPQYVVINCSVSNISDLNSCNFENSECIQWAGFLWNVIVKKEETDHAYTLGIYLKCSDLPWCVKPNWTCSVNVDFRVQNQIGKPNVSRSFAALFSDPTKVYGFDQFLNWNKLLHPYNGYVKDDNIIVMVRIQLLTKLAEKTSVEKNTSVTDCGLPKKR